MSKAQIGKKQKEQKKQNKIIGKDFDCNVCGNKKCKGDDKMNCLGYEPPAKLRSGLFDNLSHEDLMKLKGLHGEDQKRKQEWAKKGKRKKIHKAKT